MYPRNYDFQNGEGHCTQASLQNCATRVDGDMEYINCSTPALLTNGLQGPELYNSTEEDRYYNIVKGETQILFTFSSVEIVRDIKLIYYSDIMGNKSLPRVSVHAVSNGFNVASEPTKSRIAEVGPKTFPPGNTGLKQEIIQVNVSSQGWLLRIDRLEHWFYLSEVSFFSCTQRK